MESHSAPAKDLMQQDATDTAPEASDEAPPSLSIADLQNLLLVVGVACKRGAVQPGEMKQVGEVYERVESYLKYVASQQPQK
jgi:hypothetical protein